MGLSVDKRHSLCGSVLREVSDSHTLKSSILNSFKRQCKPLYHFLKIIIWKKDLGSQLQKKKKKHEKDCSEQNQS